MDEPGHLAAGVSHWDTGTFNAYRVNPPLTRMLAVLPALLAQPHRDYENLNDAPGYRAEWGVGRDFAAAKPGVVISFLAADALPPSYSAAVPAFFPPEVCQAASPGRMGPRV